MSMSIQALQALRKICGNCGREITWRKKWEKNWAEINFCSHQCRRPLSALDKAFEGGILELLTARRKLAKNNHVKGGAATAMCTCEEVEAMILKRFKEEKAARVAAGEKEDELEEEGEESGGRDGSDHEVEIPGKDGNNSDTESISTRVSEAPTLESLSLESVTSSTSTSSRSANPLNTRERVRKAARRLVNVQAVEIWQRGKVVDPSFAKGVMELKSGIKFEETYIERTTGVVAPSHDSTGGEDGAETPKKGSKKGRKSIEHVEAVEWETREKGKKVQRELMRDVPEPEDWTGAGGINASEMEKRRKKVLRGKQKNGRANE